MKTLYILTIAVFTTAIANAQSEHPLNQTGNNSTAVSATLTGFEAIRNTNTINLYWTALDESNMSTHMIERSVNGSSFSSIATLPAQNNAAPFRYNYLDATPVETVNYYRLRSTDKTGKVTYSKILEVDNSYRKTDVRVIPNPVRGGVMNLQMNNMDNGRYYITVYNNGGQQVYSQSLDLTQGSTTKTINLPRNLSSGSYFLQVNNGTTRINRQVLLQ